MKWIKLFDKEINLFVFDGSGFFFLVWVFFNVDELNFFILEWLGNLFGWSFCFSVIRCKISVYFS